jgi:hypothetical protein
MSAAVSLHLSEEALDDAQRWLEDEIELARTDPALFCGHVLRHDRTGKPITMATMHDEWHGLMSAYSRLILWSHVEGGKTTQLTGRLAWEIGRDTHKRFAIVGISQGAASKILVSVQKYLESEQFKEVFPEVKPGPLWTKTAFTVKRNVYSKDPTLQAVGARGHIVGARLDGVILDDVIDHQSTRTPEQRRETLVWYLSEIVGRLTEDAFVWVVGNAYYSDDFMHELALKHGFRWARYPVANDQGEPNFPGEWTKERIRKKEDELGGKGSPEAKRQLYCVPRSDESSRVQQAWIDACLARGEGLGMPGRISPERLAELSVPLDPERPEAGYIPATTHTGVDIGVGKGKKHAKTVRFTLLRYPTGDMRVVGLEAGRWSAPEIVSGILADQERFNSLVAVESNGAQKFLIDNAREEDKGAEMTVLPHNTGSNKNNPVLGLESVFADLARQRFIIPSVRTEGGRLIGATPEIREWIQGMLDYSPDAHTSDFLMACWIARENARLVHVGHELTNVDVKVLGAKVRNHTEETALEDDDLAAWAPILQSRRKRDTRDAPRLGRARRE